ncbi:LacI family DNA-binding transcriptional regulator [Microbispora sp. NEAU-D428]|uniref:LacI family DNA-binding transcriptional regulator n=1 Tax=Microbispora sitophila TaxID=2771537 RepID=UPI0018685246|nr:LacI family DNA-binding transcriptional regulator [Microbispora sitophila]MBE3011876.1 LacI family DNA-binding transcriptional regulator [Microbispora sitophila]
MPAEDAPRGRSASIWDVARVAGVSQQTVSRVINGKARVSESTRAKVLQVIAELGYRPNRLAQALAGGPVRSVTVLTSDTALYGAAATLRGMEEAARTAGFSVGISVLERDSDQTDIALRLNRPGEAVMVIAFDEAGVRALRALPPDVPVAAAVERRPDDAAGGAAEGTQDGNPWQAWLDDRAAAAHATRYLLGLGHRTVHYVAIPSTTSVLPQRTQGWQDALRSAGRPVPEPLHGGWTPRSGYLAVRSLLADRSVTAVLCGNDDLALGVMRAAREAGRDIPGDLSVVGFDDSPPSAYLNPSLTTVRLDFEGLGRACFGLLYSRLEPRSAPPVPAWSEPELIVRESSGPAPT